MALREQSATFVRRLDSWRGICELYAVEPAGYVVISTVFELRHEEIDEDARARNALLDLGSLAGMATEGEETMVFRADRDGKVLDWLELDTENGPGSRERLLARWTRG